MTVRYGETCEYGPATVIVDAYSLNPDRREDMGKKHLSVRALLYQFLEMQIPMVLGALVCFLLGRLVPA